MTTFCIAFYECYLSTIGAAVNSSLLWLVSFPIISSTPKAIGHHIPFHSIPLKGGHQCWIFRTIYGGQKPSRKRVVLPARQATYAGKIDSLESIPVLLKSLKCRLWVGKDRRWTCLFPLQMVYDDICCSSLLFLTLLTRCTWADSVYYVHIKKISISGPVAVRSCYEKLLNSRLHEIIVAIVHVEFLHYIANWTCQWNIFSRKKNITCGLEQKIYCWVEWRGGFSCDVTPPPPTPFLNY